MQHFVMPRLVPLVIDCYIPVFEFFILDKSSEVMLAADPILLGQKMKFRSFISIRPFINSLADGHAYSLDKIKG